MKPYYEDDLVTLYHGRCEDVLPQLETSGSTHLLTDPPYFKVKDNDWDNQWSKAAHFLDWMGEWLDLAKPLLSADASVWVFASPQLSSAVESVVAQRFRVLNSVRWKKEYTPASKGWASVRSFISDWEGIVFAERAEDEYGAQEKALHREVFGPLGKYIESERRRAGIDRRTVAAALPGYKNIDSANANIFNWELGKNLIGASDYEAMRSVLGAGYLEREHSELSREYAEARGKFDRLREERLLRRPFALGDRQRLGDIWEFASVPPYRGRHVCEKPLALLTYMIETTTRPGDTIIDCFAGSGAVLDAARQLGRKAIGIEMDEHWCEQAAKRLTVQPLRLVPADDEIRSSGWSGTEQMFDLEAV